MSVSACTPWKPQKNEGERRDNDFIARILADSYFGLTGSEMESLLMSGSL